MHLYVWIRGIKHDVDRFLNELSAKYVSMTIQGQSRIIQVGVRYCSPFFEIVFPKEHLSTMVNTFGGEKALQGQETVQFAQKYIKIIRKIMKLKKIENIDEKAPCLAVYHDNIEILGIGIKEDKVLEDGTEYL